MLTELYIEALLVDQVWYMWDAGVIDNELATIAWMLMAV